MTCNGVLCALLYSRWAEKVTPEEIRAAILNVQRDCERELHEAQRRHRAEMHEIEHKHLQRLDELHLALVQAEAEE